MSKSKKITSYADLSLDELLKLQEKHRKQQEKYRRNYEARKDRTRRLIRRGALLESLLPSSETMTDEEIEALLLAVMPSKESIST